MKIDSGYHRAGIQPDNYEKIDAILEILQKSVLIEFKGFLTHAGHSYKATNEQEILAVHQESLDIFKKLKQIYQHKYPNLLVSIGDTPTCSVANSFEGIDEIRPGNFVFYDNMQYNISSCKLEDIAIVMVCPIVEKHVSREEMLIYGGAVHFSKDAIESNGVKHFGLIVRLTDSGWEFLESKAI